MSNKTFYASAFLSLVLAVFAALLLDTALYPFNIIGIFIYLVFLFSRLGGKILKKSVNYVRVLTVAVAAVIASSLIGILLAAYIADYYNNKRALRPQWADVIIIFIFAISIGCGFMVSRRIFQRYYKFENTCIDKDGV